MSVNENKDIDNELKTAAALKAALRLGHEAFAKGDFDSVAAHILNNSSVMLKYERACLASCRDGHIKIIAVSGQSEVNRDSEYCLEMSGLLGGLAHVKKLTPLTDDFLGECEGVKEHSEYFRKNDNALVLVPLLKPGREDYPEKFFWVFEFVESVAPSALNLLQLLSLHYSEALWFYVADSGNIIARIFDSSKYFTRRRVAVGLLVVFFLSFFIRISMNVVADFELIPDGEAVGYAPYAGTVDSVNFSSGQEVAKGEVVLKYDAQVMKYKLLEAKAQYDEISAELDWVKQKSFADKEQLGRVKILAIKLQEKKVEIEETQWYRERAEMKAAIDGILDLDDSEKWKGRAVRAGEKLFAIVPPGKVMAEVMLNERSASVLGEDTEATLYLHSRPETPIYGQIVSVSAKPVLTEAGGFAYAIRMKLDAENPGYIVGMRGVARVRGQKVSVMYYLFRNIVLWWRKI